MTSLEEEPEVCKCCREGRRNVLDLPVAEVRQDVVEHREEYESIWREKNRKKHRKVHVEEIEKGRPRNAVVKEELSFERREHFFDKDRSACVLDIHLDLAMTLSYISISESFSFSTLDRPYSNLV